MSRFTNVFAPCNLLLGLCVLSCVVLADDSAQLSSVFRTQGESVTGCVCPSYECPPGSGMYYAINCETNQPTGMVGPTGLKAGSCSTGCVAGSSCQPATFKFGQTLVVEQAIPGINLRPTREYVPEATNGEQLIGSFIVDFQEKPESQAITAKLFLTRAPGPAGMEPVVIGFGVEIQRDSQRPDLTLVGPSHVTHIMDHLYQVKVQDASFMVFTHVSTN